jgi:hypothetical protein
VERRIEKEELKGNLKRWLRADVEIKGVLEGCKKPWRRLHSVGK